MSFISLWAGHIEPPNKLPDHLSLLYAYIGSDYFTRDPEVCAERESVPISELLEPFSLHDSFITEASAAAEHKSLRLANTVVGIYTSDAPRPEVTEPSGCGLRFIGTYEDA